MNECDCVLHQSEQLLSRKRLCYLVAFLVQIINLNFDSNIISFLYYIILYYFINIDLIIIISIYMNYCSFILYIFILSNIFFITFSSFEALNPTLNQNPNLLNQNFNFMKMKMKNFTTKNCYYFTNLLTNPISYYFPFSTSLIILYQLYDFNLLFLLFILISLSTLNLHCQPYLQFYAIYLDSLLLFKVLCLYLMPFLFVIYTLQFDSVCIDRLLHFDIHKYNDQTYNIFDI